MRGVYASNTSVSEDRTRLEIERTLKRYGADQFAYATSREQTMIAFGIEGRPVKMTLVLPNRDDYELTPNGRARKESQIDEHWKQAVRQRWRALLLVIKAKLEVIDIGLSTIEREFMADLMLPDGQTIAQWVHPQLDEIYKQNKMLPLLPGA